jgi:hypothetical protein
MVVTVVMLVECQCSVAGAQLTLAQLNPGILGIARKTLNVTKTVASSYKGAQCSRE